jgi:hypothetical protein
LYETTTHSMKTLWVRADLFGDSYMLELLGVPPGHFEADLHRLLLLRLKALLIELGQDFCFGGSEDPVQVGGRDFALDLLSCRAPACRSPKVEVEFLLLLPPWNPTSAFIQTDRGPLAPTQSRGDGRENSLQYMRIVSNT